ncbi:hypothetical protein K470DRAFT_255225 [Piedraia hortae CBS 480.64]|uniref:Uncharacterized protein n=1 Tax=Piedraia hortae CBS 480.64 TaxID=1314780 RepID=A0A6A7C784_9PEZI|nr:hypothetical protein K470DRAFT_255225 [Piedraia hortae CBS 480.64]
MPVWYQTANNLTFHTCRSLWDGMNAHQSPYRRPIDQAQSLSTAEGLTHRASSSRITFKDNALTRTISSRSSRGYSRMSQSQSRSLKWRGNLNATVTFFDVGGGLGLPSKDYSPRRRGTRELRNELLEEAQGLSS